MHIFYDIIDCVETDGVLCISDDCFEQAMLMAIELSKKTATESQPAECEHCHREFPADELRRHQVRNILL